LEAQVHTPSNLWFALAPGSLSRFAHKIPKIADQTIFYHANRVQTKGLLYQRYAQPDNRGFFAASSAENPQMQQAARYLH
jgi:hypothetical protein